MIRMNKEEQGIRTRESVCEYSPPRSIFDQYTGCLASKVRNLDVYDAETSEIQLHGEGLI